MASVADVGSKMVRMTKARFESWYCDEYCESPEAAESEWETMLADPNSLVDEKRGHLRIAVCMEDFITVLARVEQGQSIEAGQRDLKNVSHESFMEKMGGMQAGNRNFENPIFAQLLGTATNLSDQVALPGTGSQSSLLALGAPLRAMLDQLAPAQPSPVDGSGSRFCMS